MAHARRLRLTLLCIVLPLLTTLARAAPVGEKQRGAQILWDAPTLHLLWNDAHGLYPALAFDAMRREVEDIFARNGLSVRVHQAKAGQSLADYPEPRVNAILARAEAESWNLGRNAIAAAIGEPGKSYSILVFHPVLLRTLGLPRKIRTPAQQADLARAMARVLAHELVHVVAPERGHSVSGLMARQLTRRVLLRSEIELDNVSRTAARAAIEKLVDTVRVAEVLRAPSELTFSAFPIHK